jgi:hypothetical protein
MVQCWYHEAGKVWWYAGRLHHPGVQIWHLGGFACVLMPLDVPKMKSMFFLESGYHCELSKYTKEFYTM